MAQTAEQDTVNIMPKMKCPPGMR